MTTQELSNAFDTLISSYNHKAEFGDLSSYADVTLDEYEKSVFLTQALDNIVKSYFDARANSMGLGFDDSIRRQADFSSLITVASPSVVTGTGGWTRGVAVYNGCTNSITGVGSNFIKFTVNINFMAEETKAPEISYDSGGVIIDMNLNSSTSPSTYFTTHLNNRWFNIVDKNISAIVPRPEEQDKYIQFQRTNPSAINYLGIMTTVQPQTDGATISMSSYPLGGATAFDDRGILHILPSDILLMLNERYKVGYRNYVVVPINHKEYDRMMSRAYAQPLKKLVWRLYEGESSNATISEIIPGEAVPPTGTYHIRYIRRPHPIILTDLGFYKSQEALQIDGYSQVTECELNPILHMDILEEAVRLALNSKGIETLDMKAARQLAQRNNN